MREPSFSRIAAGITGLAMNWCLTDPTQALANQRVVLDNYALDMTEVSIREFREFAKSETLTTTAETAGGGFEWGQGWERRPGWSVYQPFGKAPVHLDEPAVHVTWDEANRFCRWRGGRLPTASEWRRAAYTELRSQPDAEFVTQKTYRFPVGDTPNGMNTNGSDPWPLHVRAALTKKGVNGLYEMGGNVWEWLADRRNGDALTAGGSWWYDAEQTTAEAMQWKPAAFYAVYVGFRCTYDLRR
jgi:sulfatase modifying factor 1